MVSPKKLTGAAVIILTLWNSIAAEKIHHLSLTKVTGTSKDLYSYFSSKTWYNDDKLRLMNMKSEIPNSKVDGNATAPTSELLGGIGIGLYYGTVTIGKTSFRVDIDTGSTLTAIPLKECRRCRWFGTENFLDLNDPTVNSYPIGCGSPKCTASTCGTNKCPGGYSQKCSLKTHACCSDEAPDTCGFSEGFGDGSYIDGGLIHSNVTIAGLTTDVDFGGILYQSYGFSYGQFDGMLGLAYGGLNCNPSCVEPVFDNLVRTGKLASDKFGVCLGHTNGSISFGGSNRHQYNGEFQYSPMFHGDIKKFYQVNTTSMTVNDSALNVTDFKSALVDTGTTLIGLKDTIYKALKKEFQTKHCDVPYLCPENNSKYDKAFGESRVLELERSENDAMHFSSYDDGSWFAPHKCVALEDKDMKLLPNITITLKGGVELTMGPYDYMRKLTRTFYPVVNPMSFRCLGIFPMPGAHARWDVIIGDVLLQKYYVEFDRENDRIGFAESQNCNVTVAPSQVSKLAKMKMYSATTNSSEFKCGKGILILLIIPVALYGVYQLTKRSDYISI